MPHGSTCEICKTIILREASLCATFDTTTNYVQTYPFRLCGKFLPHSGHPRQNVSSSVHFNAKLLVLQNELQGAAFSSIRASSAGGFAMGVPVARKLKCSSAASAYAEITVWSKATLFPDHTKD